MKDADRLGSVLRDFASTEMVITNAVKAKKGQADWQCATVMCRQDEQWPSPLQLNVTINKKKNKMEK